MQTEEDRPPAKEDRPPYHYDAEAQGLSQITTTPGPDTGTCTTEPSSTSVVARWDDLPSVIDPKAVARQLAISLNTAYAELEHGSLSGLGVRVGRQWRIDRDRLRRHIEGGVS